MKKLSIIIAVVSALLITACENAHEDSKIADSGTISKKQLKSKSSFISQPVADPDISEFLHSQCKENGDIDVVGLEELHLKIIKPKSLLIEHNNAIFNCSGIFTITSDLSEKNCLKILEKSDNDYTDCYCHYDLQYIVDKVKFGEKTFMLQTGNEEAYRYFTFKVKLSAKLDTTIVLDGL